MRLPKQSPPIERTLSSQSGGLAASQRGVQPSERGVEPSGFWDDILSVLGQSSSTPVILGALGI
jgi:hypothetical protein